MLAQALGVEQETATRLRPKPVERRDLWTPTSSQSQVLSFCNCHFTAIIFVVGFAGPDSPVGRHFNPRRSSSLSSYTDPATPAAAI
jgi:hypothetical protein